MFISHPHFYFNILIFISLFKNIRIIFVVINEEMCQPFYKLIFIIIFGSN